MVSKKTKKQENQTNKEINLTFVLDWYFTIGSLYTFTLEYNFGKTFDIVFTFQDPNP